MSESTYDRLASIYDRLQEAVDHCAWAEYISSLDRDHNRRTAKGDGKEGRPLLLDLGCGTGIFCLEMARLGYDPIGIDASPAMLESARKRWKAVEDDINCVIPKALFLQQDISRFELYGTVDIIVCLLDTINHLTRAEQVRRLFRLCANYLNPGGLLIFDLLNYDYMSQILANNIFYQDRPEFTLFWQNRFRPQSGISSSELTLFIRQADGRYVREEELIKEKYYSPDEIRCWLKPLPLRLLHLYAPLGRNKPAKGNDRQVYVIRKHS